MFNFFPSIYSFIFCTNDYDYWSNIVINSIKDLWAEDEVLLVDKNKVIYLRMPGSIVSSIANKEINTENKIDKALINLGNNLKLLDPDWKKVIFILSDGNIDLNKFKRGYKFLLNNEIDNLSIYVVQKINQNVDGVNLISNNYVEEMRKIIYDEMRENDREKNLYSIN